MREKLTTEMSGNEKENIMKENRREKGSEKN